MGGPTRGIPMAEGDISAKNFVEQRTVAMSEGVVETGTSSKPIELNRLHPTLTQNTP